jgi:pSer/pThr/pTyr-binding forkhead associated (FHA) protein
VPYIVIKSNGQEIERRELEMNLVIGRAPDCDITIRDILLSRRHCRIEPSDDGWVIHDLQSKNGTVFNGERLRVPRLLSDNDVVRLGRSKIIFHTNELEADLNDSMFAQARPQDPGDSLAGTLSGFQLLLPGEGEIPEDMPCPQPRPKNPVAYDGEEIQALLTAIASSSWDSVYAEARQPLRNNTDLPSEESEEESRPRKRVRPSSPTDFSLQVSPAAPVAVAEAVAVAVPKPRRRMRSRHLRIPLHAVVAIVWVGFLVLYCTTHKPLARGSTPEVSTIPAPIHIDLNPPDDADILKAADKELLDSPPVKPSLPTINLKSAITAASVTIPCLPFIW